MKPPMITIPMENRLAAPAPADSTSGTAPSTVDSTVIRIGRKRTVAASITASRTAYPSSRS